ncbi:hypothetical protein CR513_04249, partial [Mucuna pruriens]
MEVVVNDVEERHEVLRNDVNQLKEQIGQILEILQNPNKNAPKQPQYPLYGLPPRYTPSANDLTDPHTTTLNPQNQTQHQNPYIENNNE